MPILISFRNKRISVCKVISASPEAVWDILTDTRLWPAWGPSLLNADCNDRIYKAKQQEPGKNTVFVLAAVHCYKIQAHAFLDLEHWPR